MFCYYKLVIFDCVAPTVPASSSIHDSLTSLISSQTVTTDTDPIPMTTTPSTQSAMSPSTSSSSTSFSSLYSSSSHSTILPSSSSSSLIITTTNPTSTTNTLAGNSLIFIGAGVIIVVVVILIAFLVLICLLVKFNRKKKAQTTLQSDSLDFHRSKLNSSSIQHFSFIYLFNLPSVYHLLFTFHNVFIVNAVSPEMRQEIDEFRAPNRHLISSFVINDYDNPNELTFHNVKGDYMTMVSTAVPSRTVTPSRTTTPAYSRNVTPSNVSNGSGGSHYQYPRNQSPSTNQRYDSPRSIATSSLSEYDDPRVLDKTVSYRNESLIDNKRERGGREGERERERERRPVGIQMSYIMCGIVPTVSLCVVTYLLFCFPNLASPH